MTDHNFELIRDAKVQVNATRDENDHPIAELIINDKHSHTFDAKSRVSKHLDILTPEDLADRYTGGQFMFVGDELYDLRDGHYQGFVHSDEAIVELADILGINSVGSQGIRVHENTVNRNIALGGKWSDHGITVPGYNDGGEFQSELHFGWSPFVKTVNSAFMIYRLICTNGMRGMRNFMNTRIPVMNRWEEHMEIANRQIQNKVNGIVTDRFGRMGSERATIAECNLLTEHAKKRADDVTSNVEPDKISRLRNIIAIADARRHLGSYYKENVFNDSNLAAQHNGHLTTFDVYNMATEVRSHTDETDKSSNRALDKLANDLVFERKDLTQHISRISGPKICTFSDPDAAFFGEMA